MMCKLTSLGGVEELGVVLDDPADEGAPSHASGPHQHQQLPAEGRHLLHGLVQLQVRRVHLSVLPEVVRKSFLLFLLNIKIVHLKTGRSRLQTLENF